MSPIIILSVFFGYFALLLIISHITSKNATNQTFYTANRRSPWFVVAFGMVGASLSGVTFMSVPGYVQTTQFTYFGVILGYLIGYAVIALILLPLYYKLNTTSIYQYLGNRFGVYSHKSGSFFFIISRILGSSLRMYLVVFILYEYVFKEWGIPFWIPAAIFIVLILLYTFKGGIKTIVWTDTLQTIFMLSATVIIAIYILNDLDISLFDFYHKASEAGYTKMFETDWRANNFFLKQIVSGAFITITMTGLDQDMMQKNLTCKTLRDAQKNMFTLSISMLIVTFCFLVLGAILLYYSDVTGFPLPTKSDAIFSNVAFHISPLIGVIFLIGLIAAGFSSADGTLTSLTTAFCFDFLNFGQEKDQRTEQQKMRIRKTVHIVFSLLFLLLLIVFQPFHNDSLIKIIFDVASYTYGPLLGLFVFGLFTKRKIKDSWVPIIAVLSPILCFVLNRYSIIWFSGYQFGFELLIINGIITFIGLFLISKKSIT
ncbi:MAG: sodium:solute symporter [Bacteroidales bacterium]|nr:sodium:solute symporter [Bacteroidales bacterium]